MTKTLHDKYLTDDWRIDKMATVFKRVHKHITQDVWDSYYKPRLQGMSDEDLAGYAGFLIALQQRQPRRWLDIVSWERSKPNGEMWGYAYDEGYAQGQIDLQAKRDARK